MFERIVPIVSSIAFASLLGCLTASSGEDHDEADPEAMAEAPSAACDRLAAEIKAPARVGPQYRELLSATPPDDPGRAEIRRRVGLAEIAVGRTRSGCDQLAQAERESPPPDVARQLHDAVATCCDADERQALAGDEDADAERVECDTLVCTEGKNAKCCNKVAIKFEYEMLEARARGDEQSARAFSERMQDMQRRACEGGVESACQRVAPSEPTR